MPLMQQGRSRTAPCKRCFAFWKTKGRLDTSRTDERLSSFPIVKEHDLKQIATQRIVERLFDGRVSNLVAHLLSVQNVSKAEFTEIRKLIQRQVK